MATLVTSFLILRKTIMSRTNGNFGKMPALTKELAALEHLKIDV